MQPECKRVGELSKLLTGKPTGKRPSGRSSRRGEDNTRMELK